MILKRKICLLGATGVGKTSLVTRYVRSVFSGSYRTTIGVAIETRRVLLGNDAVDLVIWDLSGEDEFQSVQFAYLKGAAGYLLVADGTRRGTLETAEKLRAGASRVIGNVPLVVVANKSDLASAWDLQASDLDAFAARGWPVIRTSAATGEGVGEAFDVLARAIMREVQLHP